MKRNKIPWFFNPKEHGGLDNMIYYFIAIGMGAAGIIYEIIKVLTDAE